MINLPVKTTNHSLFQWSFQFTQSGIANSKQIEQIAESLKLFQTPKIIFNKNTAILKYNQNFSIQYNAYEALRLINYVARNNLFYKVDFQTLVPLNHITYIPEKVQVQHAQHWKTIKKPTDIQINLIQDISDSFFITSFKGLIKGEKIKIQKVKQDVIPLHKLGPQNQIKFYQQGSFYEDQLDDNGLSQYQYKFRSMSESWFGLIRFYLRVDSVCIYILDTRIYWQSSFGKKIARQFMVKKGSWDQIKGKGFNIGSQFSTNPNQSHLVYPHLETKFTDNQYISFD